MNAIGCLSTHKDPSETSVAVGSKLSGDPPPVVPPEHGKGRTLVLCFDGTSNQFGGYNSNVVQFVSLLEKDDRNKQLVYYQSGIGTYTSPQIMTPIISTIAQNLDAVFAWNLGDHIQGGYQFLMQNYIAGDKVCLFGFSRGAYTARCLAGMLHKVGLLTGGNIQQVPFAYKMYQRIDDVGWKESNGFKKTFSIDVPIEFVGVWDTVDSVGYVPRGLPFSTSNNSIRIFRHAVSLDEHRSRHKTNLWKVPTEEDIKLGTKASNYDMIEGIPDKTDVEEVWFSGCHADVGGGSVINDTQHSLARISLRWMVRECFKAGTGIMFYSDKLREIGLDPPTLYPVVLPRPPPLSVDGHKIQGRSSELISNTQSEALEEMEELRDALSPFHDQLEINKGWWVLEYLPLPLNHQEGNRKWVSEFRINAGRSRVIPDQQDGFKVHRSVKMRMGAEFEDEKMRRKGEKYTPRAKFEVEPTWIG